MGQLYFGIGGGSIQAPQHGVAAGDGAESGISPRFSWLALVLMLAMVASFGLVWFLSTP
jgi:hypothetical protein